MNPLTLVKRIQNINAREAQLGISEDASWHAKYKDSAYVYAGGLPFDLTEGDLLAIFAQYGEVVDVNLVRDKGTGKSKGFAFVAYEDQRSTNLAVDNLNGAQVVGRTIRVDHVDKYKKKEEEDEEEAQRKREERGVCRAFQRGQCTRGDGCKFSHNEQRAANTGWGADDKKLGHDSYDGPRKNEKRSNTIPSNRDPESRVREDLRAKDKFNTMPSRGALEEENKRSRRHSEEDDLEPRRREDFDRREEKRSRRDSDYELQPKSRDYHDRKEDRRPRRQGGDVDFEPKPKFREDIRQRRRGDDAEFQPKSREDRGRSEVHNREDWREEKRSSRLNDDESERKSHAGRDRKEEEKLRRHDADEVRPRSREVRHRSENGH